MAIISTLRDKMGKFLVVVVGFSIAAFVLGDILGPNSSIGNPNQNIVGEINGEEIDLVRFNSIFEQLSYNFSLNQKKESEGLIFQTNSVPETFKVSSKTLKAPSEYFFLPYGARPINLYSCSFGFIPKSSVIYLYILAIAH